MISYRFACFSEQGWFKEPIHAGVRLFKKDIFCVDYRDASVLVSLGGDGTFLRTVHTVLEPLDLENPVGLHTYATFLGLNLGHVGFLANEFDKKVVELPLSSLALKTRDLTILLVSGLEFCKVAVNEVVITSKVKGRLFTLEIEIEHEGIITYKGDGLIIASPVGSTAYNLSANGPIVYPTTKAMILTPICPFTLADRSIVLDDRYKLKVNIDESAEVFIDGQRENINGELTVEIFEYSLRVIQLDKFVSKVQTKLGWNKNIK